MIANCPSCGTHYKHEAPDLKVRARCGRCDTVVDLARLSPYRIVRSATPTREDVRQAASHLPIGLDHPALATTIARNVARSAAAPLPVGTPELWEDQDPLPPIPEMALRGAFESSEPDEAASDILGEGGFERTEYESIPDLAPRATDRATDGAATFALWLATGAIIGIGASWTMGGTTMNGFAVGGVLGIAAGWGWMRWTSPK